MRNKLSIAAFGVLAAIALACGADPAVTDAGGAGDAAAAEKPAEPTTVAMGKLPLTSRSTPTSLRTNHCVIESYYGECWPDRWVLAAMDPTARYLRQTRMSGG